MLHPRTSRDDKSFVSGKGSTMKKTLLATSAFLAITATAFAADLSGKALRAPMVPVVFSWAGCDVGVEGGGNWGRSDQVARSGAGLPITGGFDLSGGLVGGTVGCNDQVNSFVIGVENDISWTNRRGSKSGLLPFNPVRSTREKWIDTLRGRAGFARDRFFLYGTGAVALAGMSSTLLTRPYRSASQRVQ